jgi:hypothetical protein
MEHFTSEKWIDFVNQVVTTNENQLMEKHLKQGCQRCSETVSLWQRVRQSTISEANFQPPLAAVRIAKAAFAGVEPARQGKAAGRLRVLFDSLVHPVLEGARSARANSRQMLYRADPFQIDLLVEVKPGGNRILVTGQILGLSNPETIVRDTRIFLSNMRGQAVVAVTNQFGEFCGEIENSGDIEMTFTSPDGKPIVISLPDALGHLPEEMV